MALNDDIIKPQSSSARPTIGLDLDSIEAFLDESYNKYECKSNKPVMSVEEFQLATEDRFLRSWFYCNTNDVFNEDSLQDEKRKKQPKDEKYTDTGGVEGKKRKSHFNRCFIIFLLIMCFLFSIGLSGFNLYMNLVNPLNVRFEKDKAADKVAEPSVSKDSELVSRNISVSRAAEPSVSKDSEHVSRNSSVTNIDDKTFGLKVLQVRLLGEWFVKFPDNTAAVYSINKENELKILECNWDNCKNVLTTSLTTIRKDGYEDTIRWFQVYPIHQSKTRLLFYPRGTRMDVWKFGTDKDGDNCMFNFDNIPNFCYTALAFRTEPRKQFNRKWKVKSFTGNPIAKATATYQIDGYRGKVAHCSGWPNCYGNRKEGIFGPSPSTRLRAEEGWSVIVCVHNCINVYVRDRKRQPSDYECLDLVYGDDGQATEFAELAHERATVLLVGGWVNGKKSHSVERLIVTKYWNGTFAMQTKEMEAVPDTADTNMIGSYTYMARIGTTSNIFLKVNAKSFLFNTKTLTWTSTSGDINTPNADQIPALTYGEGLLAFTSEGVHLIKADLTSISLGSWPPTYKPQVGHGVAKINDTSFIVSGGFRGKHLPGAALGTVTGDTLTWTTLRDMKTERAWHCSFLLNNKVVVTGGWTGSSYLRSVEYLDMASPTPLSQQQWTSAPDLPDTLCGHTCDVAPRGSFAVIAGRYGGSASKTVLVMSGDLKAEVLDQQLRSTRRRQSSVVLEDNN